MKNTGKLIEKLLYREAWKCVFNEVASIRGINASQVASQVGIAASRMSMVVHGKMDLTEEIEAGVLKALEVDKSLWDSMVEDVEELIISDASDSSVEYEGTSLLEIKAAIISDMYSVEGKKGLITKGRRGRRKRG